MSTEENKALVRRYFEEVFSKGDFAAADEILAATQEACLTCIPLASLPWSRGLLSIALLVARSSKAGAILTNWA
jgi:hypothetical protein